MHIFLTAFLSLALMLPFNIEFSFPDFFNAPQPTPIMVSPIQIEAYYPSPMPMPSVMGIHISPMPFPTFTPFPTSTPLPTRKPSPTPTPKPSATVKPTIKPSGTPKPLVTPKPSTTTTPAPTTQPVGTTITSANVLTALNNYRVKNGRAKLELDQKLQDYAKSRSDYLQTIGRLDNHAGFNSFIQNQDGFNKLGFNALAENQSWNYKGTAQGLIESFYGNSVGHNNNQLSSEYTHVGIGVSGVYTNLVFGGRKK